MNITYKSPDAENEGNIDTVTLNRPLDDYALGLLIKQQKDFADMMIQLAVELEQDIIDVDGFKDFAVTKYNAAKSFGLKLCKANAIQLARKEDSVEQPEALYTNIKKQYVEFPGVDLLTVRDGYVVGIDAETVCLYESEDKFGECEPIESFSIPFDRNQDRR